MNPLATMDADEYGVVTAVLKYEGLAPTDGDTNRERRANVRAVQILAEYRRVKEARR